MFDAFVGHNKIPTVDIVSKNSLHFSQNVGGHFPKVELFQFVALLWMPPISPFLEKVRYSSVDSSNNITEGLYLPANKVSLFLRISNCPRPGDGFLLPSSRFHPRRPLHHLQGIPHLPVHLFFGGSGGLQEDVLRPQPVRPFRLGKIRPLWYGKINRRTLRRSLLALITGTVLP